MAKYIWLNIVGSKDGEPGLLRDRLLAPFEGRLSYCSLQ